MLPTVRTPLSFEEVVEAVNKIRFFLEKHVQLTTTDDGLVHIHLKNQNSVFDLLLHAVYTDSVRGFAHNKSYSLAKEAGVPAIISLQVSMPVQLDSRITTQTQTHVEYLLVGRGEDPVLLFVNVMRDLYSKHQGQITCPSKSSITLFLPDACHSLAP